ncbi:MULTISPECIES: hypothetical protein [Methanosarcina]|uniref:Uncharacterized protein n=1 Tax=Methanosarcina mazei TaxID=2209 RepID=A0A0F8CMW7_METMZ|nr:hypothetical protein [Methanosarcina mazei]KKG06264.1 hypothetical protein DU47_13590 [Methanosarcina mazei]KKH87475.1 hypothetical protein DU80_06830 [Methanosarcina mazei]UWJ23451.1 hypothetical protein MSMAT_2194 [Methanosarcina mazei TMA]BBL64193.1 hypothetical protein MmazTMA_11700 [Methanosarcina mazei]
MFTTKFTTKKSNLNKGYLEGANLERTELKAMESEILRHLYEIGMLGINEGWEKQSKLDKNAVDNLYHAKLVDKNISKGLVRLSEHGVGAVLFGFRNADKISNML